MRKIDIVAFYLPQFHTIPENDKWWGNGFTEWTNVKKAKPLFKGHYQPRIPLNNNYYDLSKVETLKWQAEIAKSYGVDGFCFYHYWFNRKMLLEKPMENLLKSPAIDINYCVCWANESWTNAWVSSQNKVLIEQTYGDINEWKDHFDYLLQFFKDPRYIKNNNKPLVIIYRPELIPTMNQMIDYWRELAIQNGFSGIEFGYQQSGLDDLNGDNSRFTFDIEYQPKYALRDIEQKNLIRKHIRVLIDKLNRTFFKNHIIQRKTNQVRRYNYCDIWNAIIKRKATSNKSVAGAFVDWDNTSRRGKNGFVIEGGTPDEFKTYLMKQLQNVNDNYSTNYLFIFAWNEWAEGGYLEPDEKNGYGYLEAIKEAKGK